MTQQLSSVRPEDLSAIALCEEEVRVSITKLDGRQRRIEASIDLNHPPELVWRLLADYENLGTFIPNLAKSCRLIHPEGGIRIEQVGAQNLKVMTFTARVVLDMTEEFPSAIHFRMVEGDFKAFSGVWLCEPIDAKGSLGTRLTYCLEVWPKVTIPVIAIEQRLRKDLPMNLKAIQDCLDNRMVLN